MVEAFGKYLLLEKLASGGMAEVYLAKSIGANGINKFLAVKRILPQYSDNPEFIEMFKEEAKIAVNLNHGNVVSIFDFGVERRQFYLVMEYVEGQNLRQLLNHMKKENKDFTLDQIVYAVKEVAAGLDHAHRCLDGATGRPLNITHRDMSPQNIMLSFEGEVKVVDFGIAKAENQVEHTRAGTIKGKFGYMSPEQADGQSVDLRTDIFSLGIVLWELLAKERLFVAQSEAATLRRVRECQIPSLRKINPNIPPELERICNKALAKDRSLRYQTSAAFHKDLNRFLNVQYPEFSTQEFSKFMKSLYNKMYVENRKKFADFAKLTHDEDRTAITQTATATMTSTDTAPSNQNANASSPPAGMLPPSGLLPQNQSRAAVIAPPTDTADDLNLNVPENSRVDVGSLRISNQGQDSPKVQLALKGMTGTYNTRNGTFNGTQSRASTRSFPGSSQTFPPGLIAAVALVLAFGGLMYFQGPQKLMNMASNSGFIESPSTLPTDQPAATATTTSQVAPTSAAPGAEETSRFAEQVPLAVHSQPSGATVYVNNQNRGFTPYRGWIELNKSFKITLVKDEYLPYDPGELKATGPEGFTLRATLQAKPPTGFVGIDVVNGGAEPVISVNGSRLNERPPISRYPVPAGIPVKIRVYNPVSQLYAEETIIVAAGQRRAVRLILGRTGQSK